MNVLMKNTCEFASTIGSLLEGVTDDGKWRCSSSCACLVHSSINAFAHCFETLWGRPWGGVSTKYVNRIKETNWVADIGTFDQCLADKDLPFQRVERGFIEQ